MNDEAVLPKLAKEGSKTPTCIFWSELLMLLIFCALTFCLFIIFRQFEPLPIQVGMVNRDVLIQEKAQEIAKETLLESTLLESTLLNGAVLKRALPEQELREKLIAYKKLYDQALEHLTKKNRLILLNKSAFASSTPPDYTNETRMLINKFSLIEEKKLQADQLQERSR